MALTSESCLYGFGGRCLKIRDVCMDFEPYVKVHNLVSFHPKSIILGQMINLDMIFHVVVPVYRLVKIETRPSSLLNFGTAHVTNHPVSNPEPLFPNILLIYHYTTRLIH